jgi:hypothetical protein
MSSNYLEKLQKFLENEGGERRNVTQIKESCLGSLQGVVCSLYLQNMTLPCKNSKQKLAGNAARTPIFVTEISVYTQKISSKVL